eukprot:380581_1
MALVQLLLLLTIICVNNAYYLSLNDMKYDNASILCQQICNSRLASIHSQQDYNDAISVISNNSYIYDDGIWIGLNAIHTFPTWTYTDGSSFDFANQTYPSGTYPWEEGE